MIFTLEIISAVLALYSTLMILIPQTRELIMMNMSYSVVGGNFSGPPSPPPHGQLKKKKQKRRLSLSIILSGMIAVVIQTILPLMERFLSAN
jgi:hypothetical protein